ncbi:MAG: DUF3147 family protein [Candidatus Sulfotelmatobacter sp.]
MQIKIDTSVLGETKWSDYALRFLFGGLITAAAGLIAKKYGPGVGGLFLAFPAIFPASATLIEKNAREEKQKRGLSGRRRGRMEAAVDAAGASIGTLGLMVFAVLIWRFMPDHRPWMVLLSATVVWLVFSVMAWKIRKVRKRF